MRLTYRFQKKVVIVTGAGKGIGRAIARAFAGEGGSVVAADVSRGDGQAAVDEIKAEGGSALFVECDVAKSSDVRQLVAAAVQAYGGLDVLCNNAGVNLYGTVVEMPEEDWDRTIDINLKGPFLACKFAIPEMRKRGGGSIVNVASVQAFASQKTVAAYAASKGGLVSLTRTVALDHAAENIRCNCIAPGSIHTPLLEESARAFAADDPRGAIADWGRRHPIGRVGRAEEVADLALFLASDEASFCTGACYLVDGGLLASVM